MRVGNARQSAAGTVRVAPGHKARRRATEETALNLPTTAFDSMSTTELFQVLPVASMRAALMVEAGQVGRWELLPGAPGDLADRITNPSLSAGTMYLVSDALHALVLRDAARRGGHAAEVLWDVATQQYAVLVPVSMPWVV